MHMRNTKYNIITKGKYTTGKVGKTGETVVVLAGMYSKHF